MTVAQQVDAANAQVMRIFTQARPVWTDVRPAIDAVQGMKANLILHPGPPVETADIALPVRTAICGAAVHEGLAENVKEAWDMVLCGEIELAPGQDHQCPCAASMVTSASMPVVVVEDKTFGGCGYSVPHPGLNPKVLRWGLYDTEVERDLIWFRDEYCPMLGEGVRRSGGIDITGILARTAGMGDENHNRQFASSMHLALTLAPYLLDISHPHKNRIIKEYMQNDRFFLNPVMAAAASIAKTAKEVPLSTVMVGMGGNGEVFGIQIAGTGNRWYTAKAPLILGSFLSPRTSKDDLLGYLGDSCMTEVYGLGGMSAIAGPSYVRLTGSTFADAKARTEKARRVSLGEHTFAPIPWDDFRGFPVGVDVRKVVGYGVLPISHGGSALKTGGQAGAGAAELPMECFKRALAGLMREIQTAEKGD